MIDWDEKCMVLCVLGEGGGLDLVLLEFVDSSEVY